MTLHRSLVHSAKRTDYHNHFPITTMSSTRISLAASAAERWSTCTISPIFLMQNADKLPDKDETGVTLEGTKAHQMAAQELLLGVDDSDVEDIEMLMHIRKYAEFVRSRTKGDSQAQELVEHEVSVFFFAERKGFIDHGLIEYDPHGAVSRIYVTDLKYGYRKVSARYNRQMSIYVKSLLDELATVETISEDVVITMAIYQPRGNVFHPSGYPVSLWAVSVKELEEFLAKNITPQAEAIQAAHKSGESDGLKFAPSEEACYYCPAKEAGICKAYATFLLGDDTDLSENGITTLGEQINDMLLLGDDTLDPAVPITLVRNKAMIVKWLDNLEDFYLKRLQKGEHVTGLALGTTREGNREYVDPDRAEGLLGKYLSKQDRTKVAPISPSEAEKALKGHELTTRWKNLWDANITRLSGRPKLIRAEDAEEPIELAQAEFENLDTDDSGLLD